MLFIIVTFVGLAGFRPSLLKTTHASVQNVYCWRSTPSGTGFTLRRHRSRTGIAMYVMSSFPAWGRPPRVSLPKFGSRYERFRIAAYFMVPEAVQLRHCRIFWCPHLRRPYTSPRAAITYEVWRPRQRARNRTVGCKKQNDLRGTTPAYHRRHKKGTIRILGWSAADPFRSLGGMRTRNISGGFISAAVFSDCWKMDEQLHALAASI